MENLETLGWLDFAVACSCTTTEEYNDFKSKNEEVGRLRGHMIANPDKH